MHKARKQQSGFTIIELVVVILLLGILTATALPRFMDVTDEAHESVARATFGGFSTGVALARAQWFATGQTSPVTLTGGSVNMNNDGYPDIDGAASCGTIYTGILQAGHPTVGAGADLLDDGGVTVLSANNRAGITGSTTDFQTKRSPDSDAGDDDIELCYYIYTAQYTTHADAVTGGTDGLWYFVYDERNGDVLFGNTGDL